MLAQEAALFSPYCVIFFNRSAAILFKKCPGGEPLIWTKNTHIFIIGNKLGILLHFRKTFLHI